MKVSTLVVASALLASPPRTLAFVPSFSSRLTRTVPSNIVSRPKVAHNWQSTFGGSSSDHDETNEEAPEERNNSVSLIESVVFSVFRGLTIPFPALRRVMVYPSSKEKTLSIGLSTREGLKYLFTYLLFGVLAYHRVVEKFSIVDALYFTCVTFSTVGYGDLVPTNHASQVFTTLFGLGGIAFLGTAIATIGGEVVKAEREALTTAQKTSRDRLLGLFHNMPSVLHGFRKEPTEQQLEKIQLAQNQQNEGELASDNGNEPVNWWQRTKRQVMKSVPSMSLIVVGGLIMRFLEGGSWSIPEMLYYSLVTASTIGFGDLAPKTRNGRLFAVAFIPLAVAAAGEIFSSIALAFIERRQKKIFESELSQNLSMAHLKAMDSDEDGFISREEYVAFMLLEMGRVDAGELQELQRQFHELDVSESGFLDREDLKLIAQLRGRKIVE